MTHRILLAANEAIRTVYQPSLERFGYQVESAADGLDCFNRLQDNPPNLVVLESTILWGGAEGVIEQMREDPELYAIPVVLITADCSPAELARQVVDPVVACLGNSCSMSTLIEHVLLAESFTYKSFVERP